MLILQDWCQGVYKLKKKKKNWCQGLFGSTFGLGCFENLYIFIKCIFQLQFERCNTKKQKNHNIGAIKCDFEILPNIKIYAFTKRYRVFFRQKVKLNKHLLLLLKLNYIIYMHISHTHTHTHTYFIQIKTLLSLSFILSPLLFYLCLFVYQE